MNIKKIMKIASDCGFRQSNSTMRVNCDLSQLEAFAKAILASELEPTITEFKALDGHEEPDPSQDKIDEAVLAERERCAKLCEAMSQRDNLTALIGSGYAHAIRGE